MDEMTKFILQETNNDIDIVESVIDNENEYLLEHGIVIESKKQQFIPNFFSTELQIES